MYFHDDGDVNSDADSDILLTNILKTKTCTETSFLIYFDGHDWSSVAVMTMSVAVPRAFDAVYVSI